MAEVSTGGAVFLAMFFLSLLVFYIIIRRGFLSPMVAGGLCAAVNVVALIMFGFTQENLDDVLVIAAAVGIGLTFSAMMTVMAIFFKNNESETLRAYDAMLEQRRNDQQQ